MNPERWQEVREILDRAIELSASERSNYLQNCCANDAALRAEVESLLQAHLSAGAVFLNNPAADLKSVLPVFTPGSNRIGSRLGVYQIVEEIGHGGMGEVYRAKRVDGQYDKEVAIKLVRVGVDSASLMERFRHERQILASLDHSNIARLYDGGTTEDGVPYLVMELIEGTPIDRYCEEHDLRISDRLQLFREVCAAVQYAHQRLVIHRDIKPSNILVTGEGVPKLLDFGIAKIMDSSAGPETTLLGPMTPEYASPEQIRGEPITTASDVYSLGVVLYTLLTGRSPYPEKTSKPLEFARVICEGEPARPSTAKAQRALKGDLDNIVLKALRKEPERRYASAEQLAEDIRRHLQGLPVLATPDSPSYRVGKFVRRHNAGVAATVLIVIAVMGGVVMTVREASVARYNERRAERRFNDVRKLANSLMFEIHDSIQTLPGATPARKIIVQRSQEYLDSLAQESSDDLSLQRELALAYEKLGQVQGGASGSNLGDVSGALASFRKALAIRQNILASGRGQLGDRISLAGTHRLIGFALWMDMTDSRGALESLTQAITIGEQAAKAAPGNVAVQQELAEDYERVGDIQNGNGLRGSTAALRDGLENHRRALAIWEQVAAASPQDSDRQFRLAVGELGVADDLVKAGERPEALNLYQHAREVIQPLAREGNNTVLMRLLTLLYSRMGDALICDGKVSEALSNYQQDFNLIQPLVAADPSDVHLRQRLVGALASMGDAQMHLGRFKEGRELMSRAFGELEKLPGNDAQVLSYRAFVLVVMGELLQKSGDIPGALRNYAQALQIYSSLSQADAPDTEDQVNLSEVRDHLGRAYLEAGQAGKASSEYERACEMSESLLSSHPDNIEILYALGDCYAGLGNVAAASARRSVNPTDQVKRWSVSLGWYNRSLSAWKRIPNPSRIAPNGFEVGGMQQATRAAEAAANKAVQLRGKNIPQRRKLRDAGVATELIRTVPVR